MEEKSAGAWVGTCSATDPDVGNTFTYSLIDGIGSADNGKFTISGNRLLVGADALPCAKGKTYQIRVRVTDQGLLSYEKAMVIGVR